MDYLGRSALASSFNPDLISTDLIPSIDNFYNVGIPTKRWAHVYTPAVKGLDEPVDGTDAANKDYVDNGKLWCYAVWTNYTGTTFSASSQPVTIPPSAFSAPMFFLYTPLTVADAYQATNDPSRVIFTDPTGPGFLNIFIEKAGTYKVSLTSSIKFYGAASAFFAIFGLYKNLKLVPQSLSNRVPVPNADSLPQPFSMSCIVKQSIDFRTSYEFAFVLQNYVPLPISTIVNIAHADFNFTIEQI